MISRLLYYNFRTVYRISEWLRNRFTPAGQLFFGGLAAAAIFGVDPTQTLAQQIAALLVALLLIAAISTWTFRPRLQIRRELPDYVAAGEPVNYKVRITNNGKRIERSLILRDDLVSPIPKDKEFFAYQDPGDKRRNWFDRRIGYPRWLRLIQQNRGADTNRVELPLLMPGDRHSISVALTPLRRGYVYFSGVSVLRADPLGLINAIHREPLNDKLLVLPKTYPTPLPHLQGQRRYQPGGVNLTASVGDSQEFATLRDYRPGDPLRHIHWRSWAKTGIPIVKEYHDEYFVRHALLLDTFSDNGRLFETGVSIAASFIVSPRTQDTLLDLMFIGAHAEQLTTGRGLATTVDILEALACVGPCGKQSFNTLSSLVAAHASCLSGVICILLSWDQQRHDFIDYLQSRNIPLLVLVIADSDVPLEPAPPISHPSRFMVLRPAHVEQDLARLNTREAA